MLSAETWPAEPTWRDDIATGICTEVVFHVKIPISRLLRILENMTGEMAHWINQMQCKGEELTSDLQSHGQLDKAHTWDLRATVETKGRWRRTGASPEAHRLASLAYPAVNSRSCLRKVEGKNQHLRWSSDFTRVSWQGHPHSHTLTYTYTHRSINKK